MSRRGRSSTGQASVEFALVLPIVVMTSLGLVVIGLAIRNELAVELAAREGARAAAVSARPAASATAAATRAVQLPIQVSTVDDGTTITVTVRYTDPVDIALVGTLVGPITHTATVTMAVEPP